MTKKNGYKPTVTIVSPETIKPLVWYTLTLNPCDDLQYLKAEDRVESLKSYFINWFLKRHTCFKCEVYMEVSRTGRLHFHGKIAWYNHVDIKTFFTIDIIDILSKFQMEIDSISDPEKWEVYITKSKHLKFPYIKSNDRKNLTRGAVAYLPMPADKDIFDYGGSSEGVTISENSDSSGSQGF